MVRWREMLRLKAVIYPAGIAIAKNQQKKAWYRRLIWNSINTVWDYAVSNGVTG